MAGERVLVNFFYAHPVGHAVEALAFAHGYHRADPAREISVALNAATAVELAALCPFIAGAYAIEHPVLEPCESSAPRLAGLPREWEWVLDDVRRHLPPQLELFPGMRDYYAASDEYLRPKAGRSRGGLRPAVVRPARRPAAPPSRGGGRDRAGRARRSPAPDRGHARRLERAGAVPRRSPPGG